MLKRQTRVDVETVKVTFCLPLDDWTQPVSVVGDFNSWDPLAHPLRRRSNGTRSVSMELPGGNEYQFRYLADGGQWFCEPHADGSRENEYAAVNSLLRT